MSIPRLLCSFDLETTGVDVTTDRVVTAACLDIDTESNSQTLHTWLADPGVEIPTEASDVHGITTDIARRDGEDHDKVIDEVIAHIYDSWKQGAALVVYNAAYDLSMLHVLSHGAFNIHGPVIDPYIIDRGVEPYRRGKRKLVNLCEAYGVEFNEAEAHAADYDCLKAAELAQQQLDGRNFSGGVPSEDMRELYMQQVGWYRDWFVGFKDWMVSQGRSIDGDEVWPIQRRAQEAI